MPANRTFKQSEGVIGYRKTALIYKRLLSLAKKRGIDIIEDSFPLAVRGIYSRRGSMHAIILNQQPASCLGIKAFTLAHELGHYQLHRHGIALGAYAHSEFGIIEDDKIELEADAFARRLLSFVGRRA